MFKFRERLLECLTGDLLPSQSRVLSMTDKDGTFEAVKS